MEPTEASTADCEVVLFDEGRRVWLRYARPRRILCAHSMEEVLPVLRAADAAVTGEGLHAAGFVSYEAGPACDPAIAAKPGTGFPLVWFGLFDAPEEVPPPAAPAHRGCRIDWQPEITQQQYRRALRCIRDLIRDGDTYQVNFTYRLRAKAADPWSIFSDLAARQHPPFAAFVDTGDWAVCSASPELFFRLDGTQIESRPMKGTAARGLWFEHDRLQAKVLRASTKDRAENVMIVDMVRNDLGRISKPGSVHVSGLFDAEQYPTVWQLTSTVRAETDVPLDRLFQALFPPASITGAPKARTTEIIENLESSPRRLYTGAIGYFAPERHAQFSVAIRTILIERATGNAEYGVGGGIVWDSRPDKEFVESQVKAKILSASHPQFDLVESLLWVPGKGCARIAHHLRRLARSAQYFGFSLDRDRVRHALTGLQCEPPSETHKVRLLLSRSGALTIETQPIVPADGFADVAIAQGAVDMTDPFLYHKTTHRQVYADALATRPGFRDVLLLNNRGEMTESTIANIVVERNGRLLTPPVSCGLLGGVYRACLLERKRIRERVITLDDLRSADGVFLVNSVRGMHRVGVDFTHTGG